jgi:hypothetical protein
MKPKRRIYSDTERENALVALLANGRNVKKTASQLNIPVATLRCWAKGKRHPELQMQPRKKSELADSMESLAWKLAESIPSKLGKASLRDIAVGIGILIDKMVLLNEPSD